jgi:hypothetical protein
MARQYASPILCSVLKERIIQPAGRRKRWRQLYPKQPRNGRDRRRSGDGAILPTDAGTAERRAMADQYRDLIDAFLEQLIQDPAFRRRLREDPQGALVSSGFARKIQELQSNQWETPDVMGYSCEDTCFNQWSCLSNSCYMTI